MTARTVEVIGGGPAGLYAARLLKRADPGTEVVVHERTSGDAETFGFGVGITESTMRNLALADPETADRIRAASFAGHTLEIRSDAGTVPLHGARNLAIGRSTLLGILQKAATDVGVDYRAGSKADPASVGADIVIAADGVRSAVRTKLSAELGVHTSVGRSRFVWCGTDFAVDASFFAAIEASHGMFVVHAYPYAEDRSTFLIEVDEQTWESSGLNALDARAAVGETDEASVALLEDVFSEQLGGRHLLTNRTRWGRFTTLSLDRWSADNVVLLGDAAHTAHYTLGSGTKLALEDSIALVEAISSSGSISEAFETYEAVRRPPVERFKWLAGRSQRWWDTYRLRIDRSPEAIALSYMTRAGNLGMEAYASDQLEVVRTALAPLGPAVPHDPASLDEWVLRQTIGDGPLAPLTRGLPSIEGIDAQRVTWAELDAWEEAATAAISDVSQGDAPILLEGPDDDRSVGARVDLAERIRMELGRQVIVSLPPAARSQGAAAVASGRCDAILMT